MPEPDPTNQETNTGGVSLRPSGSASSASMVVVGATEERDDERPRGLFARLLAMAEGFVRDRQAEAEEAVRALHDAVRAGSERLSARHEPLLSRIFAALARQLERFATYLSEASLGELLGDARDVARKRPKELVAVAFALGYGAARLARHALAGGHDAEDAGGGAAFEEAPA
ncbi:MAG: hypothetical protein H6745_15145 [Deltaproteobacteria bacterium]|nr:hypothetical protein [Deltaproteobacteria bacterium]